MMRSCLLLAAIVLGAAQTPSPSNQKFECAINSIGVADQLTNSVIFIMQGIQRCGPGHDKAECSVDVSFAIQAVQNVINLITKAVAGCSDSITPGARCAVAVGEVTSAMAGVAGTSSGIAENCPKASVQPVKGAAQAIGQALGGGSPSNFPHGLAMCIVDAKALLWTVIGTSAHIAEAHDQCQVASEACTRSVLHVTASIATLGEFIAGVVGHCSKPENSAAKCAGDVLGLLRELTTMSRAGNNMGDACALNAGQRLFLENGDKKIQSEATDNRPTLALAMLLPIAAVLSFVAGRRMAKSSRQVSAYDAEAAEEELLH